MIREKRRFSWCSQNEEGRPEVAAPWRGGGGGASSFAYRETKKEGGGERREWRRPEGRGLGFSWLGWRLKGEGSRWRGASVVQHSEHVSLVLLSLSWRKRRRGKK
jgi:hypothetical protein